MKHRILCLILCAVLCAAIFAACSSNGSSTADSAGSGHTLYVRDSRAREEFTATFKSTVSEETLDVEMKKIDSGDGYTEFSCTAEPEKFDRVVITSGKDVSEELAFNEYVSGWALGSHRFMPYTHGKELADPTYDRVSFDYENRKKDVLIWTPADYDASSDEKYSVIYMTDGQNLFDPSATSNGSWGVAESLDAMAANGGAKCIAVGIENGATWRDEELTPDIGEVTEESYKDGKGKYFSDFVVDTVMPYINENYNVYTDRDHTHVSGSSSGGIESFYIAMEHPDKFKSVGALSPAFILYSDETWVDYLNAKDFSENAPFVYLYCGDSSADQLEQALYAGTKAMPATLEKIGYPADQVIEKYNEKALHNELYWRAVFPDYLKYAFK